MPSIFNIYTGGLKFKSNPNPNVPPVWVTTTLPIGKGGQSYSVALSATDADAGPKPLRFSNVGDALPAGLTLSSTGLLSGTPVLPAGTTFDVESILTLRVTDSKAPVDRSFPLTIMAPMGTPPANTAQTWTSRTSGVTTALNGVAYGNGTFVTVGAAGVVLTSPNGQTWTKRRGTTGQPTFDCVTFANGLFVAGQSSPAVIMTSPDGVTWTPRFTGSGNQTSATIRGITYGAGRFVAVGSGGYYYTSVDGLTWTTGTVSNGAALRDVTYGMGKFITVGESGAAFFSVDAGATWTKITMAGNPALYAIAYGANIFLAGGADGNSRTSSDGGVTWSSQGTGTSHVLKIVYNGKTFLLSSNSNVAKTQNGLNFTPLTAGANLFWGLGYGDGVFVVTSDTGVIRTSVG